MLNSKYVLLAIFVLMPSLITSNPVWAQGFSTGAACQPAGPYILSPLVTPSGSFDKKTRNTMSALGIQAFGSGCKPSVVCAAVDSTEAAREQARVQCRQVRELLIQSRDGDAKKVAKAQVSLKTVGPAAGLRPGAVSIALQ